MRLRLVSVLVLLLAVPATVSADMDHTMENSSTADVEHEDSMYGTAFGPGSAWLLTVVALVMGFIGYLAIHVYESRKGLPEIRD